MADDDDYLARRMNRLTFGILSDPQDPAPVIPPDLHLVKPPPIAADGTVACKPGLAWIIHHDVERDRAA